MITSIKTTTIPISCLNDIKDDISVFAKRVDLNNFQKWIVTERYMLNPKLDFEPQSIIIAAVGFNLCNAVFYNAGKRITSVLDLPATADEVKELLSRGNNYNFFYDYWLPQKRLAVRSGLAEYGKNNICFVDDMGSLITLFVFISDMPFDKEYTWREVKNMDICNTCNLCRNNCPTGAILEDRFLIDNEKCLSAINEFGTEPFPDTIPKSVHHRIVNCSRCQDICPQNNGRFDEINETVYFSEEETALLLSGVKFEKLPIKLSEKIDICGMKWFYESLPRNLKTLFDNSIEDADIPNETKKARISASELSDITMCGYRCDLCKAFVDNIKQKDQREMLSRVWGKYYQGLEIPTEDIYCDGCRCMNPEAKRIDNACPVRMCVIEKGIKHCGFCEGYPCDVFLQREGLSCLEAKQKLGEEFDQSEYDEFLLAYDNKTRLNKFKKLNK